MPWLCLDHPCVPKAVRELKCQTNGRHLRCLPSSVANGSRDRLFFLFFHRGEALHGGSLATQVRPTHGGALRHRVLGEVGRLEGEGIERRALMK